MKRPSDTLHNIKTKSNYYLQELTLNTTFGRQTSNKFDSSPKPKKKSLQPLDRSSDQHRNFSPFSHIASSKGSKYSRNLGINMENLKKIFPFAADNSQVKREETEAPKTKKGTSDSAFVLPNISKMQPKMQKPGKQPFSDLGFSMAAETPKIGTKHNDRSSQQIEISSKNVFFHTEAGMLGNKRKINQDRPMFRFNLPHNVNIIGVCDGHGLNGHYVSSFISDKLMNNFKEVLESAKEPINMEEIGEKVYANTNNELIRGSGINVNLSGSTVVSVVSHNKKLYCFNVGDSRVILASKVGGKWTCKGLSVDLKPGRPDQRERIIRAGGRVEAQRDQNNRFVGPLRVWMSNQQIPGLAMTRAFGDTVGVRAGVIGTPQLIQHQLTGQQCFLASASDGVCEYLSNQQVMDLLIPFYQKNNLKGGCQQVVRRSCVLWKKYCMSRDDITIVATDCKRFLASW